MGQMCPNDNSTHACTNTHTHTHLTDKNTHTLTPYLTGGRFISYWTCTLSDENAKSAASSFLH